MTSFAITSPEGVFATLASIAALFFWVEKKTGWRCFQLAPPLIFIYFVPLILTNQGILPAKSPVYDGMRMFVLPALLLLLLLKMNLLGATRILGRGLGVMLFGTMGVMVGAVIGLLAVRHWLEPGAWRAFGALSGSWIGGSANMAAVAEMIKATGAEYGMALVADAGIAYLVWLPILIASKRFAEPFARFTGAREIVVQLAEPDAEGRQEPPTIIDILLMLCVALVATWIARVGADGISRLLTAWFDSGEAAGAELNPLLDVTTWNVLLITTLGIILSFTPASRIRGTHEFAMALLFLYVARMGATAELTGVAGQVVPFIIGALICILTHGAFCLLGAKVFKTDIHTAAIASAANVGGAATATIVAGYHKPSILPAAILMALIGYALGNYGGYLTALACRALM